jgi:threonine dehydrogenase-like Zn-dependent dehydrogenase
MIGLGAVAGAARRGATVVAVDVDDAKLRTARAAGARHGINSKASSLHAEIERLTGGRGADVVIEAAGLPATYRAAVDEVAFAGRVACIGYAKEDVAFATKLFVHKEIDLRGSRNATPKDFEEAAAFLAEGTFPRREVVTREVPLDRAGEALAEWARDPGTVTKILVAF